MARTITAESKILIAICLADMLSTVIAVLSGFAVEYNPLMAACIRRGIWVFIFVKLISFAPFILAVEYYRRKNPEFSRNACRSAIVLYIIVYIGLTIRANLGGG